MGALRVEPEFNDLDTQALARVRAQIIDTFVVGGPLSQAIAGYTPRLAQQELALAVLDTIVQHGTLVAEAGTGTGKTFAYLVAALLAGGKVLVSTGTRTLQDQVFHKDIKTLRQALRLGIEVAILKGRQNYICLHRLAQAQVQGRFAERVDASHLRTIVQFVKTTNTGDRAELAAVPESATIWPHVTSTRENCLGQECPQFSDCFVYQARREAQRADVVVVNHHLFLADLALRDDAIKDFLPSVDTVILDEAHQLPQIASDFFSVGWSLSQLIDLASDIRTVGLQHAPDGADWMAQTRSLEYASKDVRLALAKAGLNAGQRIALDRITGRSDIALALRHLGEVLTHLVVQVKENCPRAAEFSALASRAALIEAAVKEWTQAFEPDTIDQANACPEQARASGASNPNGAAVVRWVGLSMQGAQFHATPLEPGVAFSKARCAQPQAWVLTSATLTVDGQFDAYLAQIGLLQAKTARWDSPFDYAHQARLYLPKQMPSPLAKDFPESVADAVWPVIQASGGRAFVLCTTLRAVERIAQRLQYLFEQNDCVFPLLVQGTGTRRALLERFRSAGNAVLVGSMSFWEGIDVRGQALSVVAIDKLPFAPPDDPVVEAKIKRIKALGGHPFMDYQLPEAITALKQGAGRLIRDEKDRGVLMLLDERIVHKPYGRLVRASLPPFACVRDLESVQAFLAEQSEWLAGAASY